MPFQTIIYFITGVAALVGVVFFEHVHSPRWSVKTLGDAFVVPEIATHTTIREQRELQPPRAVDGAVLVDESAARFESERTLYTLTARLVEAQVMEDGDYHLVLEDPTTGLRLVAEIPDGDAPMPTRYAAYCHNARHMIDALIGQPSRTAMSPAAPPLIEITGVGFFDSPHLVVPTGMAPNYREIHPVLIVKAKER